MIHASQPFLGRQIIFIMKNVLRLISGMTVRHDEQAEPMLKLEEQLLECVVQDL